ncbi:hypothetical protein C8J56DRAFT_1052646 [Mycena floridula]|nr:hypothetical protein C8J56DRAFT_1052646 [Mycena floridula]
MTEKLALTFVARFFADMSIGAAIPYLCGAPWLSRSMPSVRPWAGDNLPNVTSPMRAIGNPSWPDKTIIRLISLMTRYLYTTSKLDVAISASRPKGTSPAPQLSLSKGFPSTSFDVSAPDELSHPESAVSPWSWYPFRRGNKSMMSGEIIDQEIQPTEKEDERGPIDEKAKAVHLRPYFPPFVSIPSSFPSDGSVASSRPLVCHERLKWNDMPHRSAPPCPCHDSYELGNNQSSSTIDRQTFLVQFPLPRSNAEPTQLIAHCDEVESILRGSIFLPKLGRRLVQRRGILYLLWISSSKDIVDKDGPLVQFASFTEPFRALNEDDPKTNGESLRLQLARFKASF